ncbi:MAG TPA: pitrilysin family protein [Ornithinimicrobium sp.]|uniref:M16 family metallopeptidase n=1 Tax=Ornithinimicrobium sp. TaxID=1977084 RepID=UPI002B48C499|nr:pitrilysin family protein [Ornithinimicrobium sp.]HKJ13159.1 pitrilysin family protein [Ornithinimicrobium sp.]
MTDPYPVVRHTLDNGLTVLVSEDHLVPEVSINIGVSVGSRHEEPGQTGLAHLFEHLMFEGSQQVADGEHFALMMSHGGRCNATTSFDRTCYFDTVPRGAAELALWLEADRHARLLPAVTQANVDNQRDVVVEEKRQRYDNQPYGDALAAMCEAVFPEGHPYRHTPIGSMQDLQAASLETVRAFYERHYDPSHTVLTMVGDLTPSEGVDWAQRYFATGSAPTDHRERPPGTSPLPPLSKPSRRPMTGAVPTDRLYVCFRLPEITSPDYLACAMALDLLAGMSSSAVHRSLVREREVVIDCGAAALGLVSGTSLAYVVLDVEASSSLEEVEDALCAELARLAETPPREDLLAAAQAGAERSWLEALASAEERADIIGRAMLTHQDPDYLNTHLARVRSLDPARIAEVAGRHLRPESRAVLAYRRAGAAA